MTFLMTSTDAPPTTYATCTYCGNLAPFGNPPHAICLTCLYACRTCKTFLGMDADEHYCPDCSEAMAYDAWDKVQP